MVKLLLWPLALLLSAWRMYKWLMDTPIDWALPFENTEDYRWRN